MFLLILKLGGFQGWDKNTVLLCFLVAFAAISIYLKETKKGPSFSFKSLYSLHANDFAYSVTELAVVLNS